ncbi:aldehyde dehydrogenase (NADP(+)) [Desertivibrio insolitus]|uniref:aldehyde dehydrogenase (NADP(+)) n=1 Tax=Herbiconiux sp. SYSU D00978 TaxID=2812562 RepID=UPI001A96E6CF|nr:aldehyde dehydrogenase (NADP(+)) [Herbiconiux sp. SYSU D00978]
MSDTTPEQIDALARAAARAHEALLATDGAERAGWLRAVADSLDAAVDELVQLADQETALGETRLRGEVARTTGQLRLFGGVAEEGSYLEAVIDHADPAATPPRPDLRRILRPVGPVAVFAASNFPFAFSVAGGDTASALAVGCPVIVKAHPGHPLTSRRTADLVAGALQNAGAPEGTFALVEGYDAGLALVDHPAIAAVSFTGSVAGGRALHDRAAARPTPIPFFGELGSINPVVITRSADESRGDVLAQGLAGSFQLGAGQFCTKPGVVFVPRDSTVAEKLPSLVGQAPHRMLTESIAAGFHRGLEHLSQVPGVTVVAGAEAPDDSAAPVVVRADAATLAEHADTLFDEVFGPLTVLIDYDDEQQVTSALSNLGGSLTGTLHAEDGDDVGDLVAALERISGRVLFQGWPTGVAVTWSQHHGGPYPATTSQHTSVGATAVRRFLRPIAYQDAPASVLPAALREENPLGIPRRVDGVLQP